MIIKNMLKVATLLLFSSFCHAQISQFVTHKLSQIKPQQLIQQIEPQQLMQQIQNEEVLTIIDVRTENEYSQGHIKGAINIPYDQLLKEQSKIIAYKDQQVIIYCHSGRRAAIAENTLETLEFTKIIDLNGHMLLWDQLQYPLVK